MLRLRTRDAWFASGQYISVDVINRWDDGGQQLATVTGKRAHERQELICAQSRRPTDCIYIIWHCHCMAVVPLAPSDESTTVRYVKIIFPIFSIDHSTCDGLKSASNVWCLVHCLGEVP